MAKTIKVIDLLNKIANGEDVPKKILYRSDILKFDKEIQDYMGISKTGSGSFFNYLFVNHPTSIFINDEVTVIEEQQDIETLDPEEVYFKDGTELVYKLMYDKINEIAMRVNKISKNIEDKEYCENCGVKLTEENKYMNGLCMECKCGELQND